MLLNSSSSSLSAGAIRALRRAIGSPLAACPLGSTTASPTTSPLACLADTRTPGWISVQGTGRSIPAAGNFTRLTLTLLVGGSMPGVWGGYNCYSTSRQGLRGLANGSTYGYEVSTFGDAGYNIYWGKLTFGPIVAMQYTTAHISGFTENGSLVPLDLQGILACPIGSCVCQK